MTPDSSAVPVLRIEGLCVAFTAGDDVVHALDAVDLEVTRGEVHALVGESGSGKTLAALSAVGLLPPAAITLEGRLEIDGQDLAAADRAHWAAVRGAEVGMVFQEPLTALNPVLTIGDQLEEAVRCATGAGARAARARALDLAARVGLPDPRWTLDRYPHELSGGMRQRVVIAGAIAGDPTLIIADEPTTALDSTIQRQILELLLGVVDETSAGLLLITHDVGLVAQTADQVTVLHRGRVQESGRTAQVFSTPVAPATRELIRLAPRDPRVVARERAAAGCDTETPDREPLLIVEGLTTVFPALGRSISRGVRDATFTVAAGETLGVVGASGSGKTTLAKTLVGIHRAQAGTIQVAGSPLVGLRRRGPAPVQMVFQDPRSSLDPRHRLWRILTEPLTAQTRLSRNERRERAAEALVEVGLAAEMVDRFPHQLSGGQRQRVGIARAVISRPSVIVLDEPLSALDVSVQSRIITLLRDLQVEHRFAYVVIAHGLESIAQLADHVAVMEEGRIVEQGSLPEVFLSPAEESTRALLEAVMPADPALAVLARARTGGIGRPDPVPVP